MLISDEDLSSAIAVDMYVYNVLVPKSRNADIVEYGDVVKVYIDINYSRGEKEVIIGANMLGEDFDENILGMKVGDQFDFTLDGVIGQVTVQSILMFADSINDKIAKQYYDCDSAQEAIIKIKHELLKTKVFDYIYPQIIRNSRISEYHQERNKYVNRVVNLVVQDAVDEGYDINEDGSIDTYLNAEMGMSLPEYRRELETFYDEYLILRELFSQEDEYISQEELDSYNIDMSGYAGSLYKNLGREYVIYNVYYDKLPDLLMKYYQK